MVAKLIIIGVIFIIVMITGHILTCRMFTTIRKEFPDATLEETVNATVKLSSIRRKGK